MESLKNAVNVAYAAGKNQVKLYFMMGLPTETFEDLQGIADLANKIVDRFYQIPKNERGKNMEEVIIYTDGACSGNPGPGGWGAILFYEENKKEKSHIYMHDFSA